MATLLLIDDDPDLLRDRVSHAFPAPAHRVEIAQTGAEGLERVAAACPDVILLDLRLPDQSGLDILRQLRRSSSGNGSGPTFVTCTRRRTGRWTGSCCRASWSTRAAISSRPLSCWGSPGKPCA